MTHRRFALTVALALLGTMPALGQPLTTAFTYQGRLTDGGNAANAAFDLQLILFDDPAGGAQVGPSVALEDVAVVNGLFVVTLDFGGVFTGARRWLQIGVRPGASAGAYAIVSPRQELTATPASLFSSSTPWTGVRNKPSGFADDVDDDVLGGLPCSPGQIPKWGILSWNCSADANTTYTAGSGISIADTVISIPTSGVTSAMVLDGSVAVSDLNTTDVDARYVNTGDAYADLEDAGHLDDNASADIQTRAQADARFLNVTDELTGTNYGGCGTYTILNCTFFLSFSVGPACNQVPVGGICRVSGTAVCAGTTGGTCGDGSTWYLKVTP